MDLVSKENNEVKIDFLFELAQRNCQLIIDEILENMNPISVLKISGFIEEKSGVCKNWNVIIQNSKPFKKISKLSETLRLYYELNPTKLVFEHQFPYINLLYHNLHPYKKFGPNVTVIFAEKFSVFVGLIDGMILEYDISEIGDTQVKSKYFDFSSEDKSSVIDLTKNGQYLAGMFAKKIIIWSLETNLVVTSFQDELLELLESWSEVDKIALTQWNQLVVWSTGRHVGQLLNFNSETIANFQYISNIGPIVNGPVRWNHIIVSQAIIVAETGPGCAQFSVLKMAQDNVEHHVFGLKEHSMSTDNSNVAWITDIAFDYPILMIDNVFELQIWNVHSLFHVRTIKKETCSIFYGFMNWVYWRLEDYGVMFYGSLLNLFEDDCENWIVKEDPMVEFDENTNELCGANAILQSRSGINGIKLLSLRYEERKKREEI